jgi:hypothetical protein
MKEHKKDNTPVLARFRKDLTSISRNVAALGGRWVVVSNVGLHPDGWDPGWNLAGPFGYGGLPDEWFDGWMPLPSDDEINKQEPVRRTP